MNDTPKEIEDRFREMVMSRSPVERLKMAADMFDAARVLVQAGIRRELGDLSPVEMKKETFLRFYGQDFSEEEMERILKALET